MKNTLSPAILMDVVSGMKLTEAKTPHENQCDKIGKKRSYPTKSTEAGSLSHDTDYDDDGEEMMRMKVKKRKEENVMESPTSPSLTLMVPVKTQLVYSTFKIKFTCKKNFNRHQAIHSGKYPFKSIASMHHGAMKGKTNQNHQKVLPPPLMVRRELVEENFAKKSDPPIIINDDQSEESPKQKASPFIIWEDNPSETNKPPINNDTYLSPSYPNCDSAANKFSFFSQNGLVPQKKRKQLKKSDPPIIINDHQSEESPKQKASPFIIWEDNPLETNKPLIINNTCLSPSYPNCDSASNKLSFFSQNGLLPQKKQKPFKKSVSHFSSEDKENVNADNSNKISNYVCSVCRIHFVELDLCLFHQEKQHPNIECNFLEVEQGSNIAALHYPVPNQVGVLGRSVLDVGICKNIMEYKVYRRYKCTKCSRIFYSVPRLHSHIVECGTSLPGLTDNNYQCKRHINDLSCDPKINMIQQK